MAKYLLDHEFCLNRPAPEKNPAIYYDNHKDAPNGFALKVTPAGSKKWILRYYVQGKERRMTLDKGFPSWGPRRARKEARDLRIMVISGTDLLAEKEAEKQAIRDAQKAQESKSHLTLGALLLAYVKQLEKRGKNSSREVEWSVRKHVERGEPNVWNTPADDLTMPVFRDLLAKLIDSGKWREAQKLRAYLRAAYTVAIGAHGDVLAVPELRQFNILTNPARDVAPFPKPAGTTSKKRKALSLDELRAYWKRINDLPNPEGALLRLHLLTGGQRLRQLCRLTADDIDGDEITLYDTKGRRAEPREHRVPIRKEAQRALDDIGAGPYLVSFDGGKTPAPPWHISRITKAVSEAMLKAKETEQVFTGKIIRATVETRLTQAGIPPHTLAYLLSHGLGGVQEVSYQFYDFGPEKLRALKTLLELLNETTADVVPIRQQTKN